MPIIIYLCILHFPKILWCVFTLYTVKSHENSRGQSSSPSSDSQCDHKGRTPDLEEISKGFSVLTSLRSDFCLVYSQMKETLQKDQGQQRQGQTMYEVGQLLPAAVHWFFNMKGKIEM